MFMRGFITEDLEPVIDDLSVIAESENIRLKVILDTGYNGALCLPRKYKKKCKLQSIGVETFELADGSLIKEELFIGQIIIDGNPCFVEITFTDSAIGLIGMQLLDEKIATFNLKNRTIEVSY